MSKGGKSGKFEGDEERGIQLQKKMATVVKGQKEKTKEI